MLETASQALGLFPELEARKSGLPFWLFYLLLSAILLLLFINFLQNKNLRQKISFILAGPRRRLDKLRTEVQLRREIEKKEELLRELGKLASGKKLKFPEVEDILSEIKLLEEESYRLQGLWHETYRNLERLKLEKRKNLAENSSSKSANSPSLDGQIKHLENEKKLLEDRILALNEQLNHYHLSIGRVVNKYRPDYEDLAFLYFQVDKAEKAINELETKLKNF
jgi:chromosome segregation ATPase